MPARIHRNWIIYCIAEGNVKLYTHSQKTTVAVKETKHVTTVKLRSCTPDHLSPKIKTYIHTKSYIHTFIGALFRLMRREKAPQKVTS